ncbi:beta-ketoacyl-[acyl-carrier-protein] synthase family protein [Cytobacillus kochii]|uniref:beta-ketoacyl-[acyl-carrier-protein] synthase family protein n=1 Tax=Cytobacillus kochii TaxID=859143 RepID=UPI001CD7E434|nr:beta-ketoacyl-[acyl-carrier-protein] synthase family protein [Cytobacillus kochii]MCA1028638.1 beta-ketoacyl-[acyl-carrier-protein] synthase family protein [Cytobacillus kochii]
MIKIKRESNIQEVAVTGIGIVSSIGFNTEDFFLNLCEGKEGTNLISGFDTSQYRRKIAAQILGPLPNKKWANYNRVNQMLLSAVEEALIDSGLNIESSSPISLSFGTMIGGVSELEDIVFNDKNFQLNNYVDKLKYYPINAPVDILANEFNLKGGLKSTVMTACASGTTALGVGFNWIRYKRADIVICGGYDIFRPLTHLGLSSLRIISPDKVRPFDLNRKGILIGEGAGVIILESVEHAMMRKAKTYTNVLGYGSSCDANDLAHPDGDGMQVSMEKAILESGLSLRDINYINAHGTGTLQNDLAEARAITKIFNKEGIFPYVSSIKGAIGHTIGAAGAIEAIATILSIYHSKIPPNLNVKQQDDNCKINLVKNKYIKKDIKAALSNSFGFGGNNASIIFGGLNE